MARQRLHRQDGFGDCFRTQFFSGRFHLGYNADDLLMSLVFLAALHLESSSSLGHWAGFGALSGLGALTDPVVMSVAPFLGVWAWYRL